MASNSCVLEPFTSDAFQQDCGAVVIGITEFYAMVIPEIKLTEVAL